MMEKELKVMFAKSELDRRQQRRLDLLQRVRNELFLTTEPLSEEDRAAFLTAMRELANVNEAYHREIHRRNGYWKNLWLALWGAL